VALTGNLKRQRPDEVERLFKGRRDLQFASAPEPHGEERQGGEKIDMIFLHDTFAGMKEPTSTLTERGQVSVPASIRKRMNLRPGQKLRWERISEKECRVMIETIAPAGPLAVLGYGPKLRGDRGRRTADWMEELRAGERK